MEENKPEQEKPEVYTPKLTIEIMPDGQIRVTGCINDKLLSYGLLESARDAIQKYHDNTPKLVKPNGNGHMIDFVRNFKR